LRVAMRREDAVITDFGATARQDMLQEALEKLDSGEGGSFQPLSTIISIAKCDVAIVNGFDATVSDGDAKDITGEIFQNLVARTGMFGMHHPVLFPERSANVFEQAGFVQGGAHLGTEDDGQGADRNQECGIFRGNPARPIAGKSTGGDQHVDVRMVKHRARPGVKDGQDTQTRSDVTRIASQLL